MSRGLEVTKVKTVNKRMWINSIFFIFYFISLTLGYLLGLSAYINILTAGILTLRMLLNKNAAIDLDGMQVLYLCFWLFSCISSCAAIAVFGRHTYSYAGLGTVFISGLLTVYNCMLLVREANIEKILTYLQWIAFLLCLLGCIEYVIKDCVFRPLILLEENFVHGIGTDSFRIRTAFYHPIIYAAFLTFVFAATLYYPNKNRFIDITLKGLILFNLFATKSRSSWMTVFAVTIFFLMDTKLRKLWAERGWKRNILSRNRILYCLCAILIAGIIGLVCKNYIMQITKEIFIRMQDVFTTNVEDSAGRIRIENVINVLRFYGRENTVWGILFGRGAGANTYFSMMNPVYGWDSAIDNQYASTLLNVGAAGFMMVLAIVYINIRKLIKSRNKIEKATILAAVSLFISMFFYEGIENRIIVLLLSLSLFAKYTIDSGREAHREYEYHDKANGTTHS